MDREDRERGNEGLCDGTASLGIVGVFGFTTGSERCFCM